MVVCKGLQCGSGAMNARYDVLCGRYWLCVLRLESSGREVEAGLLAVRWCEWVCRNLGSLTA